MKHLKLELKALIERVRQEQHGAVKVKYDRILYEINKWYDHKSNSYEAEDLLNILQELEEEEEKGDK